MSERKGYSRREFLRMGGAFAAGAALGVSGKEVYDRSQESEKQSKTGKEVEETRELAETSEFEAVEAHTLFDANPDYLKTLTPERGEWTDAQRAERTVELAEGVRIFRDVGMAFYYVQSGDTISEIREKLAAHSEFAYLADQRVKINSFNIPAKKLRADLWIPIPVHEEERRITKAQFVAYAQRAIADMQTHETYGEEVERILAKVSERELIVTMTALAKQEAGGLPLGQFALHRWEPHQGAFSFSLFHVLMKGPGLKARRALNLSEGQTYHPENAVKLFLAFMIEKSSETRKHADRLFPIGEHEEDFAVFYNGAKWKKINPHYVEALRGFYSDADAKISEDGRRVRKPPSTEAEG